MVDWWAETPNLNSNDNAVEFHYKKNVVKSVLAHPELYAETPNLKIIAPAKMNHRPFDDVMVAAQKKSGMNNPSK